MEIESVGVLILAGGHSSRMGTDKAGLVFQSYSFAARLVSAFTPDHSNGVCTRVPNIGVVAISCRKDQNLPEDIPKDTPVIYDRRDGCGPLQGVADGLMWLADRGYNWSYVCSVDTPLIDFSHLAQAWHQREHGMHVQGIVPMISGRTQPLTALYRSDLCSLAMDLLDRQIRAMHAFVDCMTACTYMPDQPECFASMNTMSDYERFIAHSP